MFRSLRWQDRHLRHRQAVNSWQMSSSTTATIASSGRHGGVRARAARSSTAVNSRRHVTSNRVSGSTTTNQGNILCRFNQMLRPGLF
eukprot:10186857-Alexandrium_andersonii.AAC.1